MKPCPQCKSRATKIVHMSAADKAIECQICGYRYDEHERVVVGYVACWSEQDGKHCRKPKGHEGECVRY